MEKMVISFLKLSEKFSMSERQRKVNDFPLFLISRKEQTMRFELMRDDRMCPPDTTARRI